MVKGKIRPMDAKLQSCRKLSLVSMPALVLSAVISLDFSPATASSHLFYPRLLPPEILSVPAQTLVANQPRTFSGRVLARGTRATTWQVLTDYNNFNRFLPNVASSRLLSSSGNRKVFEQVNSYFIKKFRVQIAATETYPQQISFRVIKGDVKTLNGIWQIQPAANNQVLIVHQVSVDPGPTPTRDLFFNVYKDTLDNTLVAVKKEVERRSKS
jgi:ribosome-associated toxin RatA of RatAB toxin-antitoxin module